MRRFVSTGVAVTVLTAGLTVVVSGAAVVPVAPAAAVDLDDVPDVPSVPLPNLPTPVDPADAIDGLPHELDQLPTDEVSSVPLEEGWVDVPGMPIDVRLPTDSPLLDAPADEPGSEPSDDGLTEEPTDAPSDPPSAEEPTDNRSGGDEVGRAAEPTDEATDAPSTELTDEPSETAPSDAPSTDPADPLESDDGLTVSLTQPEDLGAGAMLLEVEADATVEAEPEQSDPGMAEPDVAESAVFVAEPTDPTDPADPVDDLTDGVDVRVSYAGFDNAFGGDWENGLVIQAYPACFLTSPESDACATGVPVEAVNNPGTDSLRFTTLSVEELDAALAAADEPAPIEDDDTEDEDSASPSAELSVEPSVARSATTMAAAAAEGSGIVYSVTSAPGGYGPTPISSAGEWQVGVGSGEFSYAYPFELPSALGGATPGLSMSYSSGAVDGMTMARNGQASPAGLGWEMSPGYVSRSYIPCSDDGLSAKGDMCWKTLNPGTNDRRVWEEFTLSLNGRVSRLVPVSEDNPNRFRLRNDPGWRVVLYAGAEPGETNNADNNNEGFKVTSPDGTDYWFGWGRGSDAVWTMPVYGNNKDEPCYGTTNTPNADRWCQQGWRWNLDRVVDASGNVTRYFYSAEENYYARWANTTTAFRTAYDRGGMLTRVEYGYPQFESGLGDQPRQYVVIGNERRCRPQLDETDLNADCSGSNGPTESPGKWPDVPSGLICKATGSCTVGSPSFFTTRRYDNVTTFTAPNGEAVRPVDTYDLQYTMPDPDGASGDDPSDLWLNQIIRRGIAGGSPAVELPAVNFNGVALKNRVAPGSGRPFMKYRIDAVFTETGGKVEVDYGHADDNRRCDAAYVNSTNRHRWNSERECFAVKWAPTAGGDPGWEWFHKYVVKKVALADTTLGLSSRWAPPTTHDLTLGKIRVYSYDYEGLPGWRYTGSPQVSIGDETWSDWRGYEVTKVKTHAVDEGGTVLARGIAEERITRFRGMDGNPSNATEADACDNGGACGGASVSLNTVEYRDAPLQQPRDLSSLEGLTAETVTYDYEPGSDGNDRKQLKRVYSGYKPIETANFRNRRKAFIRFKTLDRTTYQDPDPAQDRVRTIRYENDPDVDSRSLLAGATVRVHDLGDPEIASDNVCTTTGYFTNITDWIQAPEVVKTWAGDCQHGVGEAPLTWHYTDYQTNGLPKSSTVVTDLNSVSVWVPPAVEEKSTTAYEYDTYGRVTKTTVPAIDGGNVVTETAYNTGGWHDVLDTIRVKQIGVLDADRSNLGHTTDVTSTTTVSKERGLPTAVTDANGNVTRVSYDALGRTTSVRYPGQPAETPSITYDYRVTTNEPSRVLTRTLREDNGNPTYDRVFDFYDGWGRLIESHVPEPEEGDGRIVSLTGYDELGQVRHSMPGFANPNLNDFSTVVNPDPNDVEQYAITSYDALTRPIQVDERSNGSDVATTTTDYRANVTTQHPPVGGKVRTRYDARDQVTEVELFNTAESPSVVDRTEYTYKRTGQLSTVTKSLGEANATRHDYTWAYGYDMAGRQTWAYDPDTGTTTTTYDSAGNPKVLTTGPTGPKDQVLDSGNAFDPPSIPSPMAQTTTTYDRLNRPITVRDTTSTTTEDTTDSPVTLTEWDYDNPAVANSIGQLTQVTQPITGVDVPEDTEAGSFATLVGAYDNRGRVTTSRSRYPTWITGETADATTPGQKTLTTTTAYNEANLPTSIDRPAVGNLPAQTVSLIYGRGGRIKRIAGGGARLGEFTYDKIGRTRLIESGTTDQAGAILNGLARTYNWDNATGRLTDLTGGVIKDNDVTYKPLKLAYAYDKIGNPLRITATDQADAQAPAESGAWCYSYDDLNRLETVKTGAPLTGNNCATPPLDSTTPAIGGQDYRLNYTYKQDRLTAVTSTTATPIGTTAATVDYKFDYAGGGAKPHQTSALIKNPSSTVGDTWPASLPTPGAITYDDQGRIETWTPTTSAAGGPGTTTYDYNNQGQLTENEVTTGATMRNTFAYHHDGTRMIRRTDNSEGVSTTLYLPDGTEITHTDPADEAAAETTTTARMYTTPAGTPLASQERVSGSSSAITWLLADQQRSIRLTLKMDGTSATVNRQHYYPYGEPVDKTSLDAPGDRGYLDKPHDPNGDIRLDHRSYTPDLNQLTTPDPLLNPADPQSFNPYAYARNNPVGSEDPSGLSPTCAQGIHGTCNYDPNENKVTDYEPDDSPAPPDGTLPGGDDGGSGTPLNAFGDAKAGAWGAAADTVDTLYNDGVVPYANKFGADVPEAGISEWFADYQRGLYGHDVTETPGYQAGYLGANLGMLLIPGGSSVRAPSALRNLPRWIRGLRTGKGNAANGADDLARLTTSQQRSLRSLQVQVEKHQAKLDDYRANPDAYDNLGILERAPTPEIRQSIIDGRIRHLETEIRTFQDQIDKLLGGG